MGTFIEPLIIQGINKDVAPGAMDYSGRRILNPVRDVLNARYLTSEGENAGKVEHIRGAVEIADDYSIFQEITENSEFDATLDPWLQLNDGDISFSYSSGAALVSSSGSGSLTSNTLYQLNDFSLKAGELARFTVIVTSSFFSTSITGAFLDADLNIISTFNIGSSKTSLSSAQFSTLKSVPEGAKYVGFHLFVNKLIGGTSNCLVEKFKVDAHVSFVLPSGLNECIGAYENIEKNSLFFFLWNSNGYHGLYKLDGSDNTIAPILTDDPDNPVLDFDRYHLITGIGMIGDMITWTENRKPQRYVNVTRTYPTLNDQLISLAKIGPKNAPTFTARVTDSSLSFNKLASDSFQFSFQYIYQDNEQSVLSPYSKLCTGDIHPEVNSTSRAKVQVTHIVDSEVSSLVKEVRLLYRKNNEPNWYCWKKVTNFSSSITEYFFNNEQGAVVAEAQATKLFDQVPNKSRALTIFRGRVFLNINEEGFDFVPPTLTCSLASSTSFDNSDITTLNVQSRGAFLKKNGTYLVGLFFRDTISGRLSGICSKGVINGPAMDIASTYNINASPASLDAFNRIMRKFNVSISGVGPPNCEYFLAITKEQNYAQYMQVPAHILWYLFNGDFGDNINEAITATSTDRVYRKDIPSNDQYKYLHFLLPKGLPFVADKDCFVRFVSQNITKVERVLDVLDGDILVTTNFGVTNWSSQPNGIKGVPLIEIFKPNSAVDPFFYSISGPYTTDSNGVLQTTAINNLEADTYALFLQMFNFKHYSLNKFQKLSSTSRQNYVAPWVFIESPSPITKQAQLSTEETLEGNILDLISQLAKITSDLPKGLQPDHTKAASSKGWPIVETKPLLQRRPATLRFSDPYIEGSEINGLNSFPVGNVYDKIGQDRSPITKLIAVGNILVAVHERHVTSIYVGEGIVRTGETGFITKVENVVGDDRKLNGEWGSYHPESVQEIDGQAFGFDIYSGCIWRYTVEGIIAVSDFGMANYFKERSEQYFPYRDQLRFTASVDRYHKEYLITMPHLFLNKETVARQSVSSSLQYDFTLDPDEYNVGETYRIKIVLFNQSGTTEHRVTLNAYFENDSEEPIAEGVRHKVVTASEDEAEAIYIEFLYEGQGYVTLLFSGVTVSIYARISSEYQALTGETWAYNYRAKQWSHRYAFVPEYMGKVGTKVILFDKGRLYQHSASDTHNNFFGRQYNSRIEIEANPHPGKDKTWTSIQMDREVLATDPDGTLKVIEVSNDKGQASYTRAKEFDSFNGLHDAPILKDVNTNPALLPSGTIALRDGKDMRSKTLNIVINNDSTQAARLQKLNVLGQFSENSA